MAWSAITEKSIGDTLSSGKAEPDEDYIQTALREGEEEIS
jgi:hypothetical protein